MDFDLLIVIYDVAEVRTWHWLHASKVLPLAYLGLRREIFTVTARSLRIF